MGIERSSSDEVLPAPLRIIAVNVQRELGDPKNVLAFAAELVGLVLADIKVSAEDNSPRTEKVERKK